MSTAMSLDRTDVLTPMRRVPVAVARSLGFPKQCIVDFKDETVNRGGSSKARVARSLLAEAWRSGAITNATEIVLPSSGSTALAMADEASRQSLTLRIFLPATTVPSKLAELKRFANAQVVKVAGSSEDARRAAEQYVVVASARGRHVWLADQYNDPAAIMAHALTTAPEILKQTKGGATHIFSGIGTGSTSTALALVFRPLGIDVIGVEPASAAHALVGLKYTPAVPADLTPRNLRIDLLSDVRFVSDDAAFEMTRLLVTYGFQFGPSTGAVCVAARDFAGAVRSAHLVLIAHDSALHYPHVFKDADHV